MVEVIDEAGAASGCPKAKGNLIYYVATKARGAAPGRRRPGVHVLQLARGGRRLAANGSCSPEERRGLGPLAPSTT